MPRSAPPKPEQVPADSKPTIEAVTKNIGFTPKYDFTIISAAEHARPHCSSRGSKSRNEKSISVEIFQAKGDERPIAIVTAGPLPCEADVCFAPLIVARQVDAINSIAEGLGPSIFAVLFALICKGILKMTTSHTSGGR